MENQDTLFERSCEFILSAYPDWRLTDLRVAGAGLEFLVCSAVSEPWGPIAIKTPWERWISNDNDPHIDARDLLRQEATITMHLRRYGVALPAVYKLHLDDDGLDFLVSEFMESDESLPDMFELGRLMRDIHRQPVPQLSLVACDQKPLNAVLAERTARRLKVAATLAEVDLPNLRPADIEAILDSHVVERPSLLHMDARPANLLTCQGSILGLIDWSNALIGDVGLELARIAEYGYLDEAFLRGYGQADGFAHLPRPIELVYRLDTAVMLAVVFLSEAPDPKLADAQVKRVRELSHLLDGHRLRGQENT